jgi:flavin-binding protein dodecin
MWTGTGHEGRLSHHIIKREKIMSVAKVTEIISSSSKSFDDAVENGIKRASKTLKGITGAWVADQKVTVNDGKIEEYRVVLKVTFILAD